MPVHIARENLVYIEVPKANKKKDFIENEQPCLKINQMQ